MWAPVTPIITLGITPITLLLNNPVVSLKFRLYASDTYSPFSKCNPLNTQMQAIQVSFEHLFPNQHIIMVQLYCTCAIHAIEQNLCKAAFVVLGFIQQTTSHNKTAKRVYTYNDVSLSN